MSALLVGRVAYAVTLPSALQSMSSAVPLLASASVLVQAYLFEGVGARLLPVFVFPVTTTTSGVSGGVAFIGIREDCDEVLVVLFLFHFIFEQIHRIPLVIAVNQMVSFFNRVSMYRLPINHGKRFVVCIYNLHQRHRVVKIVSVLFTFLIRIVHVGFRRSIDMSI